MNKLTTATLAFTAVMGTTAATAETISTNPFSFAAMDSGYMVLADGHGNLGDGQSEDDVKPESKSKDGKCGEGKSEEGKCGGNKPEEKSQDAKCGEGKCGSS